MTVYVCYLCIEFIYIPYVIHRPKPIHHNTNIVLISLVTAIYIFTDIFYNTEVHQYNYIRHQYYLYVFVIEKHD
jgi:hypothetical protein